MRNYGDPMDFADPFVCVGIVSLVLRSGCTMTKYKSWRRKHHVPLPPVEDIASALELSRAHGQTVISTNAWLKNGGGKGGKSNVKSPGRKGGRRLTSPEFKRQFFITQDGGNSSSILN